MTSHAPNRREAIRPALDELGNAQDALFEDLESGFEDRRDLLLWFHKASARTLGRIPDDYPRRVIASPYTTRALTSEDVSEMERFERQLVRDNELLEAASAATRFMAQRANQYADGREGKNGQSHRFGKQRWLLMRPAYDELVARQRTALKRVLGVDPEYPEGLEDQEDVSSWVRSVLRSTRGKSAELSHDAIWSRFWRQALTADPRGGDLHLLLAHSVLSVMNRALREEANEADESASEQGIKREAFNS